MITNKQIKKTYNKLMENLKLYKRENNNTFSRYRIMTCLRKKS